jgi:protein involved in plasmid replication-relaxation
LFLTRKQIERLFTLPTNTTNKDLLWLVTAGYLERRYRADTFAHFQEPVYYLGRIGWQMTGRPAEEFRAYQRRIETRAESDFEHSLAVYDVYLKFMMECKVRRIVTSDDHSWQEITAVRLKLEQNQLVDVFGEIGARVNGLKGA